MVKEIARAGTATVAAMALVAFTAATAHADFVSTLGPGKDKDLGPTFGISFQGTTLTYHDINATSATLTIDLTNAGAGVITDFSITLNQSLITSASFASSNLTNCAGCSFPTADMTIPPAFDSAPHDGFGAIGGPADPYDLGVSAQGNNGVQTGDHAIFTFNLFGTGLNTITNVFSANPADVLLVDLFDEKDGFLKNVFWVGHSQELPGGDCSGTPSPTCIPPSLWVGGAVVGSIDTPEPTTLALLGGSLLGLGVIQRRRRKIA
jgi:hypothetical protein